MSGAGSAMPHGCVGRTSILAWRPGLATMAPEISSILARHSATRPDGRPTMPKIKHVGGDIHDLVSGLRPVRQHHPFNAGLCDPRDCIARRARNLSYPRPLRSARRPVRGRDHRNVSHWNARRPDHAGRVLRCSVRRHHDLLDHPEPDFPVPDDIEGGVVQGSSGQHRRHHQRQAAATGAHRILLRCFF